MRMRLGVPLLAALVGLLGAVRPAAAGHCGADRYNCCAEPCCDAQCCFTSCQQECRTCYKLVYDTVLEKRWHTCYQTVNETVCKPVCKTCYKTVQETCIKNVQETCYRDVQEVCTRPVTKTCWNRQRRSSATGDLGRFPVFPGPPWPYRSTSYAWHRPAILSFLPLGWRRKSP